MLNKSMKNISLILGSCLLLTSCTDSTSPKINTATTCQVGEYSTSQIKTMKTEEFKGLTTGKINSLSVDLLNCQGHPDPLIRDGVVFETLSFLLRQDKLDDATKIKLFESVLTTLKAPSSDTDKDGFLKPFAALNLSEIARADRKQAYLSDEQRSELVAMTAAYMENISDYRGYSDTEGWRHGVAHSADLILQLSLNPNIKTEQLMRLHTALSAQIAPNHAYVHGESERLLMPVFYMLLRDVFSKEDLDTWIRSLADPAPLDSWDYVYRSEDGLARLHNTKAFLNALYVNASESKNEKIRSVLPATREALKKLP